MASHVLNRTSPKGERFIGRCRFCGKEGLTMNDAVRQDCPVYRRLERDLAREVEAI